MIIPDDVIVAADLYLDGEVAEVYQQQPLAQDWARVGKVAEEMGEAITELISWTQQNPRKAPDPAAYQKLLKELADVVVTGTLATQHLTKDITATTVSIQVGFAKMAIRTPDRYRASDAALEARDNAYGEVARVGPPAVSYQRYQTELLELIDQRDQAVAAADRLAYAIGTVEEIGEHSNGNDPYTNALELLARKLGRPERS
jgi:hypothetical protein